MSLFGEWLWHMSELRRLRCIRRKARALKLAGMTDCHSKSAWQRYRDSLLRKPDQIVSGSTVYGSVTQISNVPRVHYADTRRIPHRPFADEQVQDDIPGWTSRG